MQDVNIGIIGCSGRMGKALIQAVHEKQECRVGGGAVLSDHPDLGKDLGDIAGIDPLDISATADIESLITKSDIIIDFTTPETSLHCAKLAATHGTAHIVGTTGFSDEELQHLHDYAKDAVIVSSFNMSIGVNILSILTQKVAQLLDDSYDIEIVEMHHNHKVDAPSGTALMLGQSAAKGREVALEKVACKSRDGIIGARPQGEIGFSTLRGGDVVGEHTVIFAGDGERIELTHKASSRKIFSHGAVRAALWAKGKPAGLYAMKDVLAL